MHYVHKKARCGPELATFRTKTLYFLWVIRLNWLAKIELRTPPLLPRRQYDEVINSKLFFLKSFGEHQPVCQLWCFHDFWSNIPCKMGLTLIHQFTLALSVVLPY